MGLSISILPRGGCVELLDNMRAFANRPRRAPDRKSRTPPERR
jgi:hypothetical protein